MIKTLPPVEIPGHVASGLGNDEHPMRVMTRRIAGLNRGRWDHTAKLEVASLFDDLADDWHTRTSPQRTEVVEDALARGLDPLAIDRRLAVEVGSGIGTYTKRLTARFETVISVDLSIEMLVRAPVDTRRVRADGGVLPLRDDSVDAVVLINSFVFPGEVERVLTTNGCVVWVNSSGTQTPIHLTTDELVGVLPFAVTGLESRAGAGTWCVARRA